jgi:hypothetical protein
MKKQKKKYKALILDVDGTLIPNKRDGMPSKKVTDAIAKASKLIHIGVATSRPYFMLAHIVDNLKLSGPSIIAGGAQVIDIASKKVLFEKTLSVQDVMEVGKLAEELSISLTVLDNNEGIIFSRKYMPNKPLHFWLYALDIRKADEFTEKTSRIPTLASHKVPSWEKGKFDLSITHASATKQHAILEVAKLLKIETHEIIGVGDGYNDFPLLMACGLKVAMGNAVDELKAIADYIAPSVEEDGVADVIEKFVL